MFTKLKSLFVIEEEGDKKLKADEKKPEGKPTGGKEKEIAKPKEKVKELQERKPGNVAATAEPGQVQEKFTNILLKSLESNNQEGFDYLEFKQSLQAIGKIQTDEAVGYQSAFAMASTMGVTVEHLVKTCQYYIEVLEKENSDFQVELRRQEKLKLGAEQDNFAKLQQSVQEKKAMVQRLQQEIAEEQEKSEEVEQRLAKVARLIGQNQANFSASFKNLKSQLEEDLVKMKRYLK